MNNISEYINSSVKKYLESKIRVYPAHVNRASEIGHPCERYLVYTRIAWNKKAKHDWHLQRIFDLGNMYEVDTLKLLSEAGITILEQQRAFKLEKPVITGHIDGKILFEGTAYPMEIKSMSPFVWQKINSIEDMLHGKYPYLRKYPGQMMVYLLMDNKDEGVFILVNKTTGQIKVITVPLDYEYAETLLQKAERIDKYVERNELPPHIEEKNICANCSFKHICLPDLGDNADFIEGALVDMLIERDELVKRVEASDIPSCQKRIKEIDDIVKKVTEGKTTTFAGSFLISGKWIYQNRGGKQTKYWKPTIINTEEENDN